MRHHTPFLVLSAVSILASGCAVMKGKETSGQYVDDTTLTTRAKAALVKDSTVSATDFNIDVYKGAVTLTGVAKSPGEVQRAIDDIKQVPGIVSVKDATRVETKARDESKPQ